MPSSKTDSESSYELIEDNKSNARPTEHPSVAKDYQPGTTQEYGHNWSGDNIRIHGRHFVDQYGRVCGLRGVNLSGSSKAPVNHDNDTFPSEHQTVTFVGRPFPLEEAHEHFSRLRRWGLTFIRFLVTWEAVEHEGHGIYDTDYLDYIRSLLSLLPRYGIVAFVVLHQDVWSRYSGGSGAPAWTLEAVGFDLHQLEATGAAWLKGVTGGGHVESERGLWPCGYHKMAAATMATCFWAGDAFASKLKVETPNGSVPIQAYLQDAFLNMYEMVVKAVGDLEGVIGFEMMNEPHPGYINLSSLHSFNYNTDLHLSYIPSAFQSFQLGAGHPTEVAEWTRSFPMPTRKTGSAILNKEGRRVWRPDGPFAGKCLWEQHGVWGWDQNKNEAIVLRESYFSKHPLTGGKIDFYEDFFYPVMTKWAERVRNVVPNKIVFVEVVPNEFCPPSFTPEKQPGNMVYAPHWYDLNMLFTKAFQDFSVNVQGLSRGMFPLKAFYWGHQGARDNFSLQIKNIAQKAYGVLGEKPVIIGETGIPMDMNGGEAFSSDDWRWQARAMDAILTALDNAMIGFTLWNYNPSNDDQTGDDWNGENFSWFSRKRALPPSLLYYEQDAPSLDNGGRILPVVVRPYPAKTAGIPIRFQYESTTGTFIYEWCNPSEKKSMTSKTVRAPIGGHPALLSRETELFVPHQLTMGRRLIVEGLGDEDSWRYDSARQTLFVVTADNSTPGRKHRLEAYVDPPPRPLFIVNDFWGDYSGKVLTFSFVFFAILSYWLMSRT